MPGSNEFLKFKHGRSGLAQWLRTRCASERWLILAAHNLRRFTASQFTIMMDLTMVLYSTTDTPPMFSTTMMFKTMVVTTTMLTAAQCSQPPWSSPQRLLATCSPPQSSPQPLLPTCSPHNVHNQDVHNQNEIHPQCSQYNGHYHLTPRLHVHHHHHSVHHNTVFTNAIFTTTYSPQRVHHPTMFTTRGCSQHDVLSRSRIWLVWPTGTCLP